MQTNDIKLIAMDMDGTLLNSQQQISVENMTALRLAQQQGIHLAICSGRLSGDIARYVQNELTDCAILSLNGAYCVHDGRVVANHVFADETLTACVDTLLAAQIPFGCFAQNRLVIFDECAPTQLSVWSSYTTGPLAPVFYRGMEGLEKVRAEGVNKVVCFTFDDAKLAAVHNELLTIPALEVTSSWAHNWELMPANVCKGTAVRELAEHLGLSAAQVMALGDFDNDLTMIEYAGLGVAMGNATETVRRVANEVTRTNDEHGVAEAIRRFALR